jgi:hypothetical protein
MAIMVTKTVLAWVFVEAAMYIVTENVQDPDRKLQI